MKSEAKKPNTRIHRKRCCKMHRIQMHTNTHRSGKRPTIWMLMEDMKRKLENWKLLLFTAGAEESDEWATTNLSMPLRFQHSNPMNNTHAHTVPYQRINLCVFFFCSAKPFNNCIIRAVQCFDVVVCFISNDYLDGGNKKLSRNNNNHNHTKEHRKKGKNVLHGNGMAYGVQRCMHTHTCTVDSSFVGLFIIDAIFIFMIRLLSQPDFYRILINFNSIFMRLCRYKLWPLVLIHIHIRTSLLSLSLLILRCISLCCIDNSLSHRFTSFHRKILLFNLRKEKSFCGWEHFEKVQTHVQCRCTNAKGTEKRNRRRRWSEKRASNHFISYL